MKRGIDEHLRRLPGARRGLRVGVERAAGEAAVEQEGERACQPTRVGGPGIRREAGEPLEHGRLVSRRCERAPRCPARRSASPAPTTSPASPCSTSRNGSTSRGFPPTLFVKDTDSLGEQLQHAFPRARVVKALTTLNADLMVHPETFGARSTVFVSGDDAAAEEVVTGILTSFGHDDVIDLGGIETARGTEMVLPIWLRPMGALGTAHFTLEVVR